MSAGQDATGHHGQARDAQHLNDLVLVPRAILVGGEALRQRYDDANGGSSELLQSKTYCKPEESGILKAADGART